MAISVKDIQEKEFPTQANGYAVEQVDDFLDEIAAQTSAAFEALGSILQSTGDRQDELPGMLMEAFIHTL